MRRIECFGLWLVSHTRIGLRDVLGVRRLARSHARSAAAARRLAD